MDNELSDSQKTAIEMLSIGSTFSAVCEALSIDRRTLYNWRQDRMFARTLKKRRGEMWATAADQLRAMLCPAVEVLQEQMAQTYEPYRFKAANAILRMAALGKAMQPPPSRRSKRSKRAA